MQSNEQIMFDLHQFLIEHGPQNYLLLIVLNNPNDHQDILRLLTLKGLKAKQLLSLQLFTTQNKGFKVESV